MQNAPMSTAGTAPANIFHFDNSELRTIVRDGEPWFVAADVASALTIGRTDDAVSRLDDDEKGTDTIRTPGGDQQMTVINESGLYSLILTSRKPEAKRFKRWVTHDVLPAIRKTGSYSTVQSPAQMLLAMAQQFVAIEEAQRRQAQEVAEVRESVAVLEAKLDTQSKHFSVVAWCNLQGRQIDITAAAGIGRKAAVYSRENGLDIGKVSDPRFGTVNTYHKSALEHLLGPVKVVCDV